MIFLVHFASANCKWLASFWQNAALLPLLCAKQESILLHLSNREQQAAESIELPASVLRLLLDILAQMANSNAVQLTPIQAELTTQQAADLLDVSHPYLLTLVATGELPAYTVGGEQRISTADLLTYQRELDAKRLQVLNEMTAYDQALGLQ